MNRLALLVMLVPTVLLAGSGSENHTAGPYSIDMGGNIITAVGGGISSVVFTHGHTNTVTWPYGCPLFDDLGTGQDGDGTLTVGSDSTLPGAIPFMRGGNVTAYGLGVQGLFYKHTNYEGGGPPPYGLTFGIWPANVDGAIYGQHYDEYAHFDYYYPWGDNVWEMETFTTIPSNAFVVGVQLDLTYSGAEDTMHSEINTSITAYWRSPTRKCRVQ